MSDDIEKLDFDPERDYSTFPWMVRAVLDALPDEVGEKWKASFEAHLRMEVLPPDDEGWIAVVHGGAMVCVLHRDSFLPGSECGRAMVNINGQTRELVLEFRDGST